MPRKESLTTTNVKAEKFIYIGRPHQNQANIRQPSPSKNLITKKKKPKNISRPKSPASP